MPPPVEPGDADRFGLTLFLALALHALLILGVTFDVIPLKKSDPPPISLEITLVHSESEKPPEKADYLAQVDQQGGGTVQEKVRPSSPFPNQRPVENEKGNARTTQAPSSPAPRPEITAQMTVERSPSRIEAAPEQPTEPVPDLPRAADLVAQSREIARLSAEIQQRQQSYAQKPRQKYISANTAKYEYAAYEDAWRLKVERIGNLNYPEEAKRKTLTGSLMLDVAIKPDGTLHGVEVVRSSGQKVLDDAAVRIVELAAPYAPFSSEMRAELDVLHIVRTWQFDSGNQFGSGG